jgi:queuine/archaeosine tRNA-ribosyltransferase
LKYYLDIMRQMREAILLGRFRAFLDSVRTPAVE